MFCQEIITCYFMLKRDCNVHVYKFHTRREKKILLCLFGTCLNKSILHLLTDILSNFYGSPGGHFYLLLTTYYLLLITYHLLLITYYLLLITYYLLLITYHIRERSGSLVECLTRDRGAAVLSLAGVTTLCS